MRFLLLGGTGQVGGEFRALPLPRDIAVVAPGRDELDLADPGAIARIIAAEPWGAVINAAAYTDVDRAESEEPIALAVNAEGPSRLAVETGVRGIPLVHVSTDYVFDGRKGAPYVEQDKVSPLNAYGRSKLAGERRVRAGNPRHVIVRTSWVYSPDRKNFVRTILRLAAERERLPVVADQRGCPTAARDIAKACLNMAIACATAPDRVCYGTYHYAGGGEASWFEFAQVIVEMVASSLARVPPIVPIPTTAYPTPARRPADTRLNCAAITRDFDVTIQPWRDALAETIDRIRSGDKVHP
jgi:dTDP-4-dehydrorhamnose reductase